MIANWKQFLVLIKCVYPLVVLVVGTVSTGCVGIIQSLEVDNFFWKGKKPKIVSEVVVNAEQWICACHDVKPGSLNDIHKLDLKPVLNETLKGKLLECLPIQSMVSSTVNFTFWWTNYTHNGQFFEHNTRSKMSKTAGFLFCKRVREERCREGTWNICFETDFVW